MSNEQDQIVTKPETGKPYPTVFNADQGFIVQSMEDAYRMAGMVLQAGWAPKGVDTREALVIAWQHGSELGLGFMSSIQNLAIINGRPCLWGDVMLGLVMASNQVEDRQEWWEIKNEALKDSRGNFRKPRADEAKDPSCTAFFMIKRKGIPTPTVQSFSWADAQVAGYDKKDGPWKTNPTRMIQMRARGFGLRDAFPDKLKGVSTREEAMDLPTHQGFDNAKVVPPLFPEPKADVTAPPKEKPKAKQPETIETPAEPVKESKEAQHEGVTKAPEGATTTEPGQQASPANPPASDDPADALRVKILGYAKTYDYQEADVIAFAKEKGILSPRNKQPFAELPESVLGMIIAQIDKLNEKFSEPEKTGAP